MRKITILVLILLASLSPQIVKAETTPDFEFTNIEVETTRTNATIKWTTTVETSSYLEYQAEENFTQWGIKGNPIIKEEYSLVDPRNEPSPTDYPFLLNHSMTLDDLKPNTIYMFRIKAKDIYDYPEYFESNFTTKVIPFWELATSTEQVTIDNTPDYGQTEDDEPSYLLHNGLILCVTGIVVLVFYIKMK